MSRMTSWLCAIWRALPVFEQRIFIHRAQVHGGLLKLAANGSGIGLIDELEVGLSMSLK